MLGVDKVFLFEHQPELPPELEAFLQPWVAVGFVDLMPIVIPANLKTAFPAVQLWLYNRCSKPDMAGAYSWMSNIDLDEFIVVLENGHAAAEPRLKHTLAGFKDHVRPSAILRRTPAMQSNLRAVILCS